jgi:hypothetical protein
MGDSCAHKQHNKRYVLSNNSCGRFDESPKRKSEQSLSSFFAFSAEVVECLLHSFPEALAERLREEATQFCTPVSISSY